MEAFNNENPYSNEASKIHFYTGFRNAQHWESAEPGSWNDPDYLFIGWVGDAKKKGDCDTYLANA
jgi:hypothetical protein